MERTRKENLSQPQFMDSKVYRGTVLWYPLFCVSNISITTFNKEKEQK